MALIDDVKAICTRLAPRGWDKLFRQHCGGLDITKPAGQLAAELDRPLTGINRNHPGLDELSIEARRGITPGAPALSVLYHALASSAVHPLTSGAPGPADYPTLDELDTIENYVFSRAKARLSAFRNPAIVVFACQYRVRMHTPHQAHADLVFARTGVARVGTEAPRYDAALRSFDARPAGGGRGFAAQPARYVAYIAEYGPASAKHAVLRPVAQVDAKLTFTMPLHKLFAGKECLWAEDGTPLSIPALQFAELHVNEKLARMHRAGADNPGRVAPIAGFDLQAPPFTRTSANSGDLIKLARLGATVLVQPVPNSLVRLAEQKVAGKTQPARFKVPPASDKTDRENRYWSSLMLRRSDNNGRAAPEYANIRLELRRTTAGAWQRRDLNQIVDPPPAGAKSFDDQLRDGTYEAAHLIDSTCDGTVTLKPMAVLHQLPILPAYSLVTAVDYFPQVDQATVAAWLEQRQHRPIGHANAKEIFEQGSPEPLSDGRFHVPEHSNTLRPTGAVPNSQLVDPVTARPAFPASEAANQTATAVVSFAAGGTAPAAVPPDSSAASWLPDAASGYFAPGWDVSEHVVDGRSTYVAYGLGSPFPEDSKLCAALNSFWPAVAPDSSRTYGFDPNGELLSTSIPLMDGEIGYHPQHPRVLAGEVAASTGWDGDEGPFLSGPHGARVVNAMNPDRADQSLAGLDGRLGFSGLDAIDGADFLHRIEEMLYCKGNLLTNTGVPANNAWLVSAEAVPDWAAWTSKVRPQANPALTGAGFIFVFVAVDPESKANAGNPPLRLTYQVKHEVELQVAAKVVFRSIDGAAFLKLPR